MRAARSRGCLILVSQTSCGSQPAEDASPIALASDAEYLRWLWYLLNASLLRVAAFGNAGGENQCQRSAADLVICAPAHSRA